MLSGIVGHGVTVQLHTKRGKNKAQEEMTIPDSVPLQRASDKTTMLLVIVLCVGSSVAQQLARETCDAQRKSAEVNTAGADFIIGGLFEIREAASDGYGCGPPATDLMQVYEAARWAVTKLNNFVRGVRIGMKAYDTCGTIRGNLAAVHDFYPAFSANSTYCAPSQTHSNLGFIGPLSSHTTVAVASLIKDIPAPTISVRAVSSVLSDKALYPTFMRTSGPSSFQIKAIMTLLDLLQWNRIAVVYVDNAYGQDGLNQILRFARATGRCVVHAVPVVKGETKTQIYDNVKVLKESGVTGAIFFGGHFTAEVLMAALDQHRQEQPSAHGGIQWIFTDLDPAVKYNYLTANGAIAVLPSSTRIDEFRAHWFSVDEHFPPTDNPWFQDWFMTKYTCRLPTINYMPYANYRNCTDVINITTRQNDYVQNQNVEPTIRAVYAYGAALKAAHQQVCFGVPGVCFNLRNMKTSEFNKILKSVNYRFTPSDGMANMDNKVISFDNNGDPNTMSHTIWNYFDQRFQSIGTIDNDVANLDIANLRFFNEGRTVQLPVPPQSLCPPSGCQNCFLSVTEVKYTYIPGDIIIGSMIPMRETGADQFTCGGTSTLGVESFIAMKYALDNYKTVLPGILPGVNLGALVADACNQHVAETFVDDIVSGRKVYTTRDGGYIPTDVLRSFVSTRYSNVAETTSKVLGRSNMLEIETAATVNSLSNRDVYPYFSRDIISTKVASSAIINILKVMDWRYAQIVYEPGPYGLDAMMSVKSAASDAQICIAGSYSFQLGADMVIDKLRTNSEARAVIVLGYSKHIKDLLQAVRSKNAKGEFVFIGTHDWGDSKDAISGYENEADGSLSLKLLDPLRSSLDSHLRSFNTLPKIRANPMIAKLYEERFGCYLNQGTRGLYMKECTNEVFTSSTPYSSFMMRGIYFMAQALHNTLTEVCGVDYFGLCNAFRDKKKFNEYLLKQIRDASFNNSGQQFQIVKGEGMSDLEIYNFRSADNSYQYVGLYETCNKKISNMRPNTIHLPGSRSLASFLSKCMNECVHCFPYQNQRYMYIPGDVMLGAMFSVSNPGGQGPFTCGTAKTTNGFQYTAAMQYAIHMVNTNQAPVSLNGIQLGGIAFDHCGNPQKPMSVLAAVYSGLMDPFLMKDSSMKRSLSSSISAWITDNTASTEDASKFLRPYNIPIVSPSATSTSLMNISTFYRTIQGDDTIAMALVKVLKTLDFKYIHVVHSSGGYGRGGLSAMRTAGQQEGVCVTGSTDFNTLTSNEIIEKLANNPTHVVVLFLGTADMTALLAAKARSNNTNAGNLVFVSPEPYSAIVQDSGRNARNMISLKLKSPSIDGFQKYLNAKTEAGFTDNPHFARYYMAIFKCNLPGFYVHPASCPVPLRNLTSSMDYASSNFIFSTINAVYAATFALDATLTELCGESYTDICQEFYTAPDLSARIISNLRAASFNNLGEAFRFLSREGNSGYNILRFDGSVYQEVGTYEGAALQLSNGLADHYTNVSAACSRVCLECIQQGLNFSFVPGDILLGGIFDVHLKELNPFSCGKINTLHGFQLLEAFYYALEQVNSKEGIFKDILNGVTLGGVGLDSCESAVRTGYIVSNIHNGLTVLNKNGFVIDPEDIDVYIGGYASDRSIYLARILRDLKIPQISYAATSTALLDQFMYPYFYRTVPADDKQVKAMLSFLDVHDMRYVQVLYTQSNYGEFGAAAFERLASEYRVCVVQMVRFPDNGTVSKESSNAVVTQLLAKPVANIIVVFAGTDYIKAFLEAVKRNPDAVGKFRFVGSETWANNEDAIVDVEEIAKGSVTVKLDTANLENFIIYLSGKTPSNTQYNPWFGEYYEKMLDCFLTASDGTYPKQCVPTPGEVVSSIRYKQDPGILHVINAVYSAAFAIHYTLIQTCGTGYTAVCEAYKTGSQTKDLILNNLERVDFLDESEVMFNFTDRREGNKGYDLYQIKFVPVRGYRYREIGSYDGKLSAPDYTDDWDGSCTRQDACTECPTIRNTGIRFAIDGPRNPDVDALTVIGVFDIHKQGNDPFRCGKVNPEGMNQFLAFFYAMQDLTSNVNLNIRSIAIDTCSNSLRVGQDIYNLLTKKGLCNSLFFDDPSIIGEGNIGGFIVAGNKNTLEASRVLDRFMVTYVRPSATSIMFSDQERYPYLARTTAPKDHLLKAIAQLMAEMKWDFITAVSSSWRFNEGGYEQFLTVSKGKTCVRISTVLPLAPTDDDFRDSLQQLIAASGSNVVVLFTTRNDTVKILKMAKELGVLEQFLWVLTDPESSSYADWNIPSDLKFTALILTPKRIVPQGYLNYISSLEYTSTEPSLNLKNIPLSWYTDFYEEYFNCQINRDVDLQNRPRHCDRSEKFTNDFAPKVDRYTLPTIAAAYGMYASLRNFKQQHCGNLNAQDCITTNADARQQIFTRLLNVSEPIPEQTDNGQAVLSFNSERYWDVGYVLSALNFNGGSTNMKQVGTWNKNAMDFNKTLFNSFVSTCPADAACGCVREQVVTPQPQVQPLYTEPRNYYLYGDNGVMIHKWPVWAIAVAVLTCLGLIISIMVTLFLLFTYPIRGGTTVLGFMSLLGIIGIYAINFAFFLPASEATCGGRRFCMGVIYIIVFAALLVKAVDNWRYSDLEWDDRKKYHRLTSACSLFMMALGIVLIQAIIPIMWLILVPPTASKMIDADIHDYWWCDPPEMYDIGLVLSFIFVIFILLLTSIFSAMGWDSDVNNRESRWILIGCICTAGCFLVWMIVTTNAGPTVRDPAVAIGNLVNATALLICIPLRKMALLIRYKREERMEKEEPTDDIYSAPSHAYENSAYDGDIDFQRQNSKPDSDVGF